MNRIIIISSLLLSALIAYADNKMTTSKADSGESFEVSVSHGHRIYEYDSNQLDTIPYLIEHARRGETWAYEALAECHRYGKGGLKRSLINALLYYSLASTNMEDCMAKIEQANHNDPIAVFSRIINYLENEDFGRIVCAVDTLDEAGYHSADILLKLLDDNNHIEKTEIIEFVTDDETDPDASLFACAGYALSNKSDSTEIDISWARPLIMGKIPCMYSLVGVEKYMNTIKSESLDGYAENATPQDIEDRRKAAEYFLKADEYGALTKQAARLFHHYCTCDSSSKWVNLSEENLCRIQQLAGLPE